MKNYIAIVTLFISSICSYAQEGVEVPFTTDSFEVESGTYIKDMDNVLNPYIGTWQGTWQGKRFTLKIEKTIKHLHTYESGFYYYEDRLTGKYKIEEISSGAILEDNLNITDYDLTKIKSLAWAKDNKFDFIYMDKDLCSNTGIIRLKGDPLSNQLNYFYKYDSYWQETGCQYVNQSDIPIPLPVVPVTLTKL